MEAGGLRSLTIARLAQFATCQIRGPIFLSILVLGSMAPLSSYARQKRKPDPITPPPAQELPANFVVPTKESIAADLKHDPKDFGKLVDQFAQALNEGVHGKSYLAVCARDEDACRILADFFSQVDTVKHSEQDAIRRRIKHFHVTDQNIEQSERFDFNVLVNSVKIDNQAEFNRLAASTMKISGCPRNLSAALSVRAEEYFPDPAAHAMSRQLFDHARQCLGPSDEAYERVYLRQGLQALISGDKVRAAEYLSKTLDATEAKEKYRSLYWLGYLANENKATPEQNKAWNDLLNEFPLSFYAIEAAVAMGKDPLAVITNRKVGGMKRVALNDDELNRQIRWLEALFVFKKYPSVGKWASWIVRTNEELDVDILHYLSTLKIASGLYRSNITMLFNYFKKNPAALNQEGLRLLYSRPFFNLIKDVSRDKIDTYLVLGLVRQESAFEARAVSHTNASGLMQLEPRTARRLAAVNHRHLMNEKDNTTMGVKYLLQLSQEFQGSVELVLASYNAGPMRVQEWLKRNSSQKENPLLWNFLQKQKTAEKPKQSQK